MPKQYPAQFGRSPLYRDPEGTLPFPAAHDIPISQWYQHETTMSWVLVQAIAPTVNPPISSVLPPGWEYQYIWTTPVFDLRPDLRSANAGPKEGVPIWTNNGRLYIQMSQPSLGNFARVALTTPNLKVSATEWVNTSFNHNSSAVPGGPANLQAGQGLLEQPSYDATSKFATAAQVGGGFTASTQIGGFAPTGTSLGAGDGHPIRFWRLRLHFSIIVEAQLTAQGNLPSAQLFPTDYVLQASYY